MFPPCKYVSTSQGFLWTLQWSSLILIIGDVSPYIGLTGMEDQRTRRVAQIMGNGPIHVEAVRAGQPCEWIAER